MYALAVIWSFFSVWCLFAISDKVAFAKKDITLTLSKNTKAAKIVALVSFLITTVLLGIALGKTIGILSSIIIWLIMASCIVLFAPFPGFKKVHLVLLGILMVGLDVLFTLILK